MNTTATTSIDRTTNVMGSCWGAKCYVIFLLIKTCYGNVNGCQFLPGIIKADEMLLNNVSGEDLEHIHTCLLHEPFLLRISVLHSNVTLTKLTSAFTEKVRKMTRTLTINKSELKEIPSGVLTNITNLLSVNLANNTITVLRENSFQNMKKLSSINLSYNCLIKINARTFKDLPRLRELSLEGNRLHSISPEAFRNLPVLDVLYMDNNELMEIPYRPLVKSPIRYWHIARNKISKITPEIEKFPRLVNLDIQDNSLKYISMALSKLHFLKILHINGNNLTTLPEELSNLVENRSFTLYLRNNPWHCDCDLLWLLSWVKNGLGKEEIFCETPKNISMELFDIGNVDCNHSKSLGGVSLFIVAAFTLASILIIAAVVTIVFLYFSKYRTKQIKTPIRMIMNGHYYRPRSVVDSADTTSIQTIQYTPFEDGQKQKKQTYSDEGLTETKVYGRLRLGKLIGRGAFGDVFEGSASDASHVWKKVAVKKIRDNTTTEESNTLVREYRHLTDIGKHPNIIQVIGLGVINGSLILVLELAENGDLLAHLKKIEQNNHKIIQSLDSSEEKAYLPSSHPHLFRYMWHVAKGMEYLSRMNLVHRDLAGRNILLSSGHVAKISDFGLSRDVYENGYYYQKSNGRLPYKWMSPETLFSGKFTTRSDVWSFGILLWEIVTLGSSPFPGIPPDVLQNMYKSGYVMPRPPLCPEYIYSIMKECWNHLHERRPGFHVLVNKLDTLLQTVVNKEYLEMCSIGDREGSMSTPESPIA